MYGNNNDDWEEDKGQSTNTSSIDAIRKKNILKIAGVVGVSLLIILMLTQCLGGCFRTDNEGKPNDENGNTNPGVSENVPTGDIEAGTIDIVDEDNNRDLQAEVNEAVEDGMFNVFINTEIYLENGRSKANLLIQNSKNNKRPVVVEIRMRDTDEVIYRSDVIPAGSKIENAELGKVLSKGTYLCIAYFNVLNPETQELINRIGVNVQVDVNT